MSAIKMLSAVILSLVVSKAVASGPVFKSNAVDHISIEHKTSIRRSEKVYDFTKLEIEAKLLDMLEDQDVINKDKMMVEYESVVSEWQELESQPSLRGGVYKWTIPDVVPCHNHNVRLTVFGKDGSRNTWSYPHTIVAPAQDMIIKSGYTPETPETINIGNYQNGQMDLSWTPSHCAGSYDVIYSPMIGGGETASIQAFDNSLTLENLESCQEYEITVYAVLGEQYSQEAVETFMTYPDDNVAEKLDPEIVPDTDNVLVKWKGSEKLSCIPKYNVQLCQDGGQCHGNVDMDRDDSVQYMEFQSNQLDMCTKYSLSIRPVHEKKYVQPKIVNFRTLSQPLEDMEELLAPVSAKIDQDMTISVSWSPVPCAEYYNVYQRHEDSDMWENIGTTEQTSFQKIGQSCSKFIYGVAVVVDGVESQKVEYDEAIVTDAKHDELPIMVVEEKANGIQVSTLTLGAVNTSLWDCESVHSSFDRRAMIPVKQAAEALLFLAQQPTNQTITDLALMPSAGAL